MILLWPPTFTSCLLSAALYDLVTEGTIRQMLCGIFGVFCQLLSSLEILIYKRMRSPVDAFLSVKHRITTPEIVSPANETMEVILGKWAPSRIC